MKCVSFSEMYLNVKSILDSPEIMIAIIYKGNKINPFILKIHNEYFGKQSKPR